MRSRGGGPFGATRARTAPAEKRSRGPAIGERRGSRARRKALPPGFTLLEIAVALSILGVGIVSCLQIFSGSLRLLDRATKQTAAVRQARTAMDAMLAVDPERFRDDVGHSRDLPMTEEGISTRLTSWIEPTDEEALGIQPTHRLYHVFVSVTWQDGRGAKSYWLDSMRMLPRDSNE